MTQPPAKKRRPALGTGLAALLPDRLDADYFLCPIEQIRPSPHQPRQHFPEDAIEELAQSIRGAGFEARERAPLWVSSGAGDVIPGSPGPC